MGMPFIRKDRPEPGPDPSEEPQSPSSVSHKTRRTLSLFPGTDPVLLKNQRALNKRLNTGPSSEALDLEQQIQIDRQDRQRISAKACLRLQNVYVFQLLCKHGRSAKCWKHPPGSNPASSKSIILQNWQTFRSTSRGKPPGWDKGCILTAQPNLPISSV